MTKATRFFCLCAVIVSAFVAFHTPVHAVMIDVDLNGTFQFDNDIFRVDFSVDSDRLVTFFTSSWLSANSGNGFDTAILLWDSGGNWLGIPSGYNDDVGLAGSAMSNGTTYGYGENDAFLTSFLSAGNYTLTLVQTLNYPANFPAPSHLSDGFWHDSEPNYTRDVYGWGPNPYFNGSFPNDPRTGNWALHLVGISDYTIPGSTPIPEPATATLLILGAGGCLFRFRRNR